MTAHNGDGYMQEITPEQLTAYALGQLEGNERTAVERALADETSSAAREEVLAIQSLSAVITACRGEEPPVEPSARLRAAIEAQLTDDAAKGQPTKVALADRQPVDRPARRRKTWVVALLATVTCALVAALLYPAVQTARELARRAQSTNSLKQIAKIDGSFSSKAELRNSEEHASPQGWTAYGSGAGSGQGRTADPLQDHLQAVQAEREAIATEMERLHASLNPQPSTVSELQIQPPTFENGEVPLEIRADTLDSFSADAIRVPRNSRPGEGQRPVPELKAQYGGTDRPPIQGQPGTPYANWDSLTQSRGKYAEADISKLPANERDELRQLIEERERVVTRTMTAQSRTRLGGLLAELSKRTIEERERLAPGTEQYAPISDNAFVSPLDQPLSTFSIDVDTASYANVRRFLTGGRLPPPDAVRIEELVNYFRYDYPQPKGDEPFSVNMEVAQCPWREGHLLLRVGLKGKDVHRAERPPSHLVFLLDVSGSMSDENKLPLLKTAMQMLVGELGENDRVSIVTYASDAGLRLPPTRGHEQDKIRGVIDSLSAGGSTHGSAGIQLAYEQAAAYFVKGGTNRVILCTDGDLNVGITDDDALVKLIKEKAAGGTFLTVLGFGEGNLKDAKMERLADNGNGVYAYIDSVREARKVLVEQLTGSTITIAKDVKIQIEFNPQEIASYRLIGYENRILAAEDFADDKKDAGEIGAGHTVTALYELAPVGAAADGARPRADAVPLRYQESGVRNQESESVDASSTTHHSPLTTHRLTDAAKSGELLTLKLRYKEPDGSESKLLEHPLKDRGGSFNAASRDMQFAASVASFGMILRGSEHRGGASLAAIAEIAAGSLGDDPGGYRAEFLDLVRRAQALGTR